MDWRQTCDKPLADPKLDRFTDEYIGHRFIIVNVNIRINRSYFQDLYIHIPGMIYAAVVFLIILNEIPISPDTYLHCKVKHGFTICDSSCVK